MIIDHPEARHVLNTQGQLSVAITAAIFLCFAAQPTQCLSQVTFSPGVALSPGVAVSGSNVNSGSWSDIPRRTTLAVGQVLKDEAGKDRFTTGGAAVLVQDARGRVFIVTARHVFDNPSEQWAPNSLQIRGGKDEKKSRYEDFGSTLKLRDNGHPLFVESKQFDLAAILAPQDVVARVTDDNKKSYAVGPQDIADANDTYDGADVFILGFPALVGDRYQQRALMRSGIIAWTDSSEPVDFEFLVDARIFPGNSGGPVFSSAAGMTRNAGIVTGKPIKLLGIVSQTINAKPELALGIHLPKDAMVLGAAGVGIIEPAEGITELLAEVP
jgi:V8-like Glu-specific endopeptidase